MKAVRKSCRKSIAIIGEKYFRRHEEIIKTIDRIQKYNQVGVKPLQWSENQMLLSNAIKTQVKASKM